MDFLYRSRECQSSITKQQFLSADAEKDIKAKRFFILRIWRDNKNVVVGLGAVGLGWSDSMVSVRLSDHGIQAFGELWHRFYTSIQSLCGPRNAHMVVVNQDSSRCQTDVSSLWDAVKGVGGPFPLRWKFLNWSKCLDPGMLSSGSNTHDMLEAHKSTLGSNIWILARKMLDPDVDTDHLMLFAMEFKLKWTKKQTEGLRNFVNMQIPDIKTLGLLVESFMPQSTSMGRRVILNVKRTETCSKHALDRLGVCMLYLWRLFHLQTLWALIKMSSNEAKSLLLCTLMSGVYLDQSIIEFQVTEPQVAKVLAIVSKERGAIINPFQ